MRLISLMFILVIICTCLSYECVCVLATDSHVATGPRRFCK